MLVSKGRATASGSTRENRKELSEIFEDFIGMAYGQALFRRSQPGAHRRPMQEASRLQTSMRRGKRTIHRNG